MAASTLNLRVPTLDEEDVKRQHREREVLVAERTAHTNRMTGMLMALGIRGVNPRRADFIAISREDLSLIRDPATGSATSGAIMAKNEKRSSFTEF